MGVDWLVPSDLVLSDSVAEMQHAVDADGCGFGTRRCFSSAISFFCNRSPALIWLRSDRCSA
jgi:hypothetical protein